MGFVASPRLVIFDPAGRMGDVASLATRIGAAPAVVGAAAHLVGFGATPVLVPGAVADALAAVAPTGARWVLGEGDSAGKVAAAAVKCSAVGVVMAPLSPEALTLICAPPPVALPEVELARARSLIAASVLDGKGEPTADGLALIARAFAADDCVFWWREGDGLVPWSTRASADADQAALGIAARVAAATGLTTVTAGTHALRRSRFVKSEYFFPAKPAHEKFSTIPCCDSSSRLGNDAPSKGFVPAALSFALLKPSPSASAPAVSPPALKTISQMSLC